MSKAVEAKRPERIGAVERHDAYCSQRDNLHPQDLSTSIKHQSQREKSAKSPSSKVVNRGIQWMLSGKLIPRSI